MRHLTPLVHSVLDLWKKTRVQKSHATVPLIKHRKKCGTVVTVAQDFCGGIFA